MSERKPTVDSIRQALTTVIVPGSGQDVVSLGLVQDLEVAGGDVKVVYRIPAGAAESFLADLRQATNDTLLKVDNVESVAVGLAVSSPQDAPGPSPLAGVKHVIAIGAGKGGVGKSTVAILAAIGLTRLGKKVGVLDGDVYGPSIPKLTGTEDAEPMPNESGRIVPPERDGVKILSMGHLVPPDQAVIWRGPMAQKYVKEMLDRGDWGELDYLIVDLPPGTGDIPLTLAQSIPLTGAVIVCTPQDIALADAVRAVQMYEKLGVDTLGIIENMSFYICPHCGKREEIFSHGGAENAAARLNVPFLGAIPLNVAIRTSGDAGQPSANFTSVEPHVIASLEHCIAQLDQQVQERAKKRTPLPTLKIDG